MREQVPDVAPFLRLGGREWSLPQALKALNHRAYRLYWMGQLVSLTGSWMQATAQQWLVYRVTGSPILLGTIMLCQTLPVTILGFPAGVIVDRVDKRVFLAWVQVALMIPALTLALLTYTDTVKFWHVAALAVVFGCANTFDMTTRQSFTIEMVGREDVRNAIALNSSIFNGARLVGPAIAGVLISRMGEAPAFLANGLSFLALIAALIVMKVPFPAARRSEQTTPLADLRESMTYLRRTPEVLGLVVTAAIPSTFGFTCTMLIPVMARERLGLGADGFGMLVSSMGFGALVGALTLATRGGPMAARGARTLVVARLAFAAGLIVFALSTSVPLSMLALVIAGWGMITHLASTNSLIQLLVPDDLRGRISSTYVWAIVGLAPIGNMTLGALAEAFSAPIAILSAAGICVLAVAASVLAPVYARP